MGAIRAVTGVVERTLDYSLDALKRPERRWFLYLILINLLAYNMLAADPDLFARLAVGKWFITHGSVAYIDPYSFTPTKLYWIDHEWLAGVFFYIVSEMGGDKGLYVAKLIFALLTMALLLSGAKINSGRRISIAIALLIMVEISVVWASTIRAQVFTYLFIPFFLLAIVGHRKGRSWARLILLALPLAMAVWANSHGGFVVGLGFIGIYAAALFVGRNRDWVLVITITLLCLLATLVNPYGILYWDYLVDALSHTRPSITEWNAVSLTDSGMTLFFLSLLLTVVAIFKISARLPFEAYCILISAALFGFRHVRLTPIFTMAATVYILPFLPEIFPAVHRQYKKRELFLVRGGMLALFPAIVFGFIQLGNLARPGFTLDYTFYPVRALDWLYTNGRGGHLLVDFNRGSYALWKLYPKYKISVDGRYEEVYPDTTVLKVSQALNPRDPDCSAALRELDPNYILMERKLLFESGTYMRPCYGSWQVVYTDSDFIIYEEAGTKT